MLHERLLEVQEVLYYTRDYCRYTRSCTTQEITVATGGLVLHERLL